MGILTDWVRNIFIMVAAVSFVEILLPAGSMGKYVKFILSLMILAVVLYPFSLLEGGKTPDPGQLSQWDSNDRLEQSSRQPSQSGRPPQSDRSLQTGQKDRAEDSRRLFTDLTAADQPPGFNDSATPSQSSGSTDSAMETQLPVPADQDTLSSIQTRQIQQVYQEKLEQAVKEQILSKFHGIQTASVHIYMNNDVTKRSYGKIRKVVIELAPASLTDQVRSFVARSLSMSRGQVQVTKAEDQTGDQTGDRDPNRAADQTGHQDANQTTDQNSNQAAGQGRD